MSAYVSPLDIVRLLDSLPVFFNCYHSCDDRYARSVLFDLCCSLRHQELIVYQQIIRVSSELWVSTSKRLNNLVIYLEHSERLLEIFTKYSFSESRASVTGV